MTTGNTTLLHVGCASHTGLVREINEDSFLVLTPPALANGLGGLLLVADGVGGESAGEVASGLLVHAFWHWFSTGEYASAVSYNPERPDYFVAVLKDLMEQVNDLLYQRAAESPQLSKMGTTGTICLIRGNQLFTGHVGDTRAYLWRNGQLSRLTTDHSWVAEEVAAGRMTEAEAQVSPKRNLVSRVLGSSPLLRVDRDMIELVPGDCLLLASDGLTGLVIDQEIARHLATQADLQKVCALLIDLANSRGGSDNITVVAARYGEALRVPGGVAVGSLFLGYPASQDAAANVPSQADRPVTQVMKAPLLPGYRPKSRRTFAPFLLATLLSALAGAAVWFLASYKALPFDLPPQLPLQPADVAALVTALAVWSGFLTARLFYRH